MLTAASPSRPCWWARRQSSRRCARGSIPCLGGSSPEVACGLTFRASPALGRPARQQPLPCKPRSWCGSRRDGAAAGAPACRAIVCRTPAVPADLQLVWKLNGMQETSSEGHCRVACEVRGQAAAAQRAKAGQAQQRAQDDAPRVGAGFQSPGRSVVPDRRLSGRRPLTASASAAGHVLQQRAGHAAGRVRGLVLRARQRARQPHRWPHAGRRQLGI